MLLLPLCPLARYNTPNPKFLWLPCQCNCYFLWILESTKWVNLNLLDQCSLMTKNSVKMWNYAMCQIGLIVNDHYTLHLFIISEPSDVGSWFASRCYACECDILSFHSMSSVASDFWFLWHSWGKKNYIKCVLYEPGTLYQPVSRSHHSLSITLLLYSYFLFIWVYWVRHTHALCPCKVLPS